MVYAVQDRFVPQALQRQSFVLLASTATHPASQPASHALRASSAQETRQATRKTSAQLDTTALTELLCLPAMHASQVPTTMPQVQAVKVSACHVLLASSATKVGWPGLLGCVMPASTAAVALSLLVPCPPQHDLQTHLALVL